MAVQSVAFQVDGATVATDTSAPYTLTGETSWLADGNHTLTAVATDTAGNTRTSATVAVKVDNNAPTVSISSPSAGATVSGTPTVTASAADAVGVQSVQFRVDGANVGSADTTSPYSLAWNTTGLTDGEHTLSAVARDAVGNTRTSANVTVTVDNDGLVAAFGFEESERLDRHRPRARPRRHHLGRHPHDLRAASAARSSSTAATTGSRSRTTPTST